MTERKRKYISISLSLSLFSSGGAHVGDAALNFSKSFKLWKREREKKVLWGLLQEILTLPSFFLLPLFPHSLVGNFNSFSLSLKNTHHFYSSLSLFIYFVLLHQHQQQEQNWEFLTWPSQRRFDPHVTHSISSFFFLFFHLLPLIPYIHPSSPPSLYPCSLSVS